ncbi:MAG: tetratricopeptide repeat protein [Deltaproteobacteria bacterium]|nr:tetratricopeptide repeat protein [Deltaproteobacteria bacterium]
MADYREYLAILDVDPDNTQAWAALEQMAAQDGDKGLAEPSVSQALDDARRSHRERGDFELTLRLLDLELAKVADRSRLADLLYEKGKLFVEDLLDENAARECFRRVLELRPDDHDVQETVAQIDMIRAHWERIVEKYANEARAATDRQLATTMFLSAAETCARYRPDAPEIDDYLRAALDVEPRNRRAAMHLERRLRQGGRWEELAQFFVQREAAATTKDERIQALLGLTDLAQARLEQPDLVLSCMKQVLTVDPGHPRALRTLIEVYSAEENWEGLVKLYEGALKARRDKSESELAMVLQVAMIYWKRLGKADAAEEYFRRIRKLDAAHPVMVGFFREYHQQRGEGSKLLAVLQQAHKLETDAQRKRQLGLEVASLAESAGANPEKAIDSWKAILRQNPRNEEARTALKRLYQRAEKWNALLELLKEEVEAISPVDQASKEARVERLLDVVVIYRDRLNLDVMVINTYNAILTLVPDHKVALEALATKYEQLGRWNDLISVLARKADASWVDEEERASLLRRVASLWIERFGNHAQAIKPLEELCALDPADREASARLKEIYAKRRQWRALLELLGREVDSLCGEARRAHLVEMAKLAAEKLGDARASIATWNRILEGNPADPEALASLAQLYDREKRYLALAEVLVRQRAGTSEPKAAVAILERLGALYVEKLEAPALAARVFQEILTLNPGHARAIRLLRELHAQAGDLDSLEALYASLGAWDDLFEVLFSVAERASENDKKLSVLERIVRLCHDKIGNPEKAIKAHERILAVSPRNLAAARALVPIYRKGEKWSRLLGTYEVLLSHAETTEDKLKLHLDIRALCEEKLGSKALAFQWCARAYELCPDDAALLLDLERLGAEADAWQQVADILSRRAENELTPASERQRLFRELGRLYAVRLHQPAEARAAWEKVLGLAPDDPEAMTALEELAAQAGRWADLLVYQRRRAELETDPAKKLEMLFKIAFIEEERVKDLAAAGKTFDKILELAPRSIRALRALAKVKQALGDKLGLAGVLEAELGIATEPEDRVALLLRLGGLYEEGGQRDKSLERYSSALALQQGNRQVHAALERFLTPSSEERVQVAALMAPVYERIDDPSRLASTLEILRAAEQDETRRLLLDRRLFVLHARKLRDPLNAYEVATRVLAAAPEDADNRRELMALADELAAFDDLAVHLEKVLSSLSEKDADPKVRVELWAELAQIYDEKLARPAPAEAAWRRLLELNPREGRAYDALQRILNTAGRWDDLRALLLRREENTKDASARREILLQICDLYEGVLDNAEGAIEAYGRVLALDRSQLRAYKALERLYEGAMRWTELEALLAQEIEQLGGDESHRELVPLLFRRAELRAFRLGDPQGAISLAEELLAREPAHAGARSLLENLLAEPTDREKRLSIARILGPRYEADGLWHDLLRMLRCEEELAATPLEAARLLARSAAIHEDQVGDAEAAFATWAKALRTDPEDPTARQAVERLASPLNRWNEAAASWEEAIETAKTSDLSLRASLCGEVAVIYDRHLGDTKRATLAYRRLLELDPTNVDAVRTAAAALVRLYEEQQDFEQLISILRKQAEWSETQGERLECFYRIASISEDRLGDAAAAIATWREVLAEDHENRRALDALERLHAGRGDARELVEILRRRAGLCEDEGGKRALLMRVASIEERDGAGPSEAVTAYLEILDFRPEDEEVLAELSRLYRQAERWPDLREVDERRLKLSHGAGRSKLLFELGTLLRDQLGRPEEALERFREILAETSPARLAREGSESDQSHVVHGALFAVERALDDDALKLRAAEILQPIYWENADHAKLIRLFELEAAAIDDPRERITRLRKIAELKERSLDDMAGAFDALARACRAAIAEPELAELLSAVQRIAIDRPSIPELVALYRELAPEVLAADLQRRMYLDIADLARGQLRDLALAKEYYRRVLDSQPDDPRALAALEHIYRELEEHQALRDILTYKAEHHDDLDVRRDALVEIATLCEERLGLPDDSVSAWERVLEIHPADVAATRALERLYASRDRFAELGELLERRLGFAEDLEEAVDLRFRLGDLYEKRLTDPERAVENYEAALGGDSRHAGAIAGLERYLEDPAIRLTVAGILEPIYIARHDWANLVRITEIRLDAEANPQNRLSLTRRIARLYEEQLEDLDSAFRWYGKVFREAPDERGIRDQLLRLSQVLDCWDGLARVYQEFLDDEGGDSRAVRDVARVLADIYDRRLGDVERARAAYQRLLASTPDDLEVFSRFESMLVRGERWFALITAYEDAIESALDGARRKELYRRIARVQEERLSASDKAIDSHRAILDLDPGDEEAMRELDRLYQEQKRWQDLADLLSRRIDRDPTSALEPRVRLAEVLELKLSETGAALDQIEHVLAVEPIHPVATVVLERLLPNQDYRSRIANLLEPIYRSQGSWDKLVGILEIQLEEQGDRGRRIELLREIARLHETRGGAQDEAFHATARAWQEDVSSEEIYKDLYRLAEERGAWSDLVSILDTGVEGMYDYDLAADLLGRIGRIEEEKRNDRQQAIAAWRRVLEVKDDEPAALDALERLHGLERMYEPLVSILERKAELCALPDQRKRLLVRIADILEGALRKHDAATATWRQVLAIDDTDEAALDSLERLYREAKDFRSLVEILHRKIELAPHQIARRPLQFAAAQVYDQELVDVYEAIAQYKSILEVSPGDVGALEALDEIFTREKSWSELVEIVDRRAALRSDASQRAELAFRAARIVELEQEEAGQAVERYRAILSFCPAQAPTRAALDALASREDTMDAASAALEDVYRAEGQHDMVAELYERRIATCGADPTRRRALLAAVAELHEVGRADLAAAFEAWGRVLLGDPEDSDAEKELVRLAGARGAWADLAALYEQVLKDLFDGELGFAYALKLAHVYEDSLGDLSTATAVYRKALELGGDERIPLSSLDRIFERQAKWYDLAEILVREATCAVSDEDRASFLYRLGDLREHSLGDAPGAVSAYSEVLACVPRHDAARAALERLLRSPTERAAVIAILEPIYEDDADFPRLLDLLEVKLTVETAPGERAKLLSRVAEVAESKVGDKVRALDAVGRWLAEEPSSDTAIDELMRLAAELSRWEEAYARLTDVIGASDSPDVTRELSLRLAEVALKLGDLGKAESACRRALDLDAQNSTALASLEEIYRALGQGAKLAEILWRRADLELDVSKKRAMYAEAADLRESVLADNDGAVEAWKQVIELDEGDREAHARLISLHERMHRYEPLLEMLELAIRFASERDQELSLRRRAAEILTHEHVDLDRAVSSWHAAIDLSPDDDTMLVALADVHARREDWLAVQETLIRRISLAATVASRVEIFRNLARIAEDKRESVDEAIGYHFQVLDLDNADRGAYEALERLLAGASRWHELVEILIRHAEVRGTLGDSDEEVALLLRAADTWEGPLANPDAAAELLERVRNRVPDNVAAMTRLARIYEAASDWDRSAGILEQALARAPQGEEGADLQYRLGRVAEARNGDVDEAVPRYREALALYPGHRDALAALERIAREREDWAALADHLLAREALETYQATKVSLLLEISEVLVRRLSQPLRAIPCLERAAELSPGDPQVQEPLADLYFAEGRGALAEPIFRQLSEKARAARKMKDLARYQQRLAALREAAGDLQEALKSYEEAFRIDPTHGPTMVGLGRIYFAHSEWEKARRIYRGMLLQALDSSVGMTKAGVYLQLGLIHARLGETQKAKGMYERGLELEPDHQGLRAAMTEVQ